MRCVGFDAMVPLVMLGIAFVQLLQRGPQKPLERRFVSGRRTRETRHEGGEVGWKRVALPTEGEQIAGETRRRRWGSELPVQSEHVAVLPDRCLGRDAAEALV